MAKHSHKKTKSPQKKKQQKKTVSFQRKDITTQIVSLLQQKRIIIPIILFCCIGLAFGLLRHQLQRYQGVVMPGVFFEGENISGFSYDEFKQHQESFFVERIIRIEYDGHVQDISANTVNSEYYIDVLWKQILEYNRSESKFKNLQNILFPEKKFLTGSELVSGEDSEIVMQDFLGELYERYQLEKPYQGKIAYNGTSLITEDSQPGREIIENELFSRLLLFIYHEQELVLPVEQINPLFTNVQIEQKKKELEQILNKDYVLRSRKVPQVSYTLKSADTKKYGRASYSFDTNAFIFSFDTDFLNSIAEFFGPQDAQRIYTEDYFVAVDPGRSGIILTDYELQSLLREVFNQEQESFEFSEGTKKEQQITTKDIDITGFTHIVSEFTTYHSCCENRVDNIHRIADLLDGVVLEPGEVLNINQLIGERTVENGFKPAGSILKGELVDSVGGGISQFITTLHNAVYWGGYEIIAHKPHSIYFSRYPMGVEATINWPYVDYIFRNDTNQRILIDTEYSDTSITVRILGDNDSRVYIADFARGRTRSQIHGGDSNSRRVISRTSAPYNYRAPLVRYKNNAQLKRGEQKIIKHGKPGWSVDVERTVLQNKELVHFDTEKVHYFSDKDTIIEIHPCDNPTAIGRACIDA